SVPDRPPHVNENERQRAGTTRLCSYVVGDERLPEQPFCDAPALPGSSYCACHQPLCVVAPESPEGRRLGLALDAEAEAPEPPDELAHLAVCETPEAMAEDPDELAVLLDYRPRRGGEGE